VSRKTKAKGSGKKKKEKKASSQAAAGAVLPTGEMRSTPAGAEVGSGDREMNRLDGGEASADLESWLDGGVLSTGDLRKMSQLEGVERHRVAIWGGVGQWVERRAGEYQASGC
jgi:hypothetical protein